MRRSPDRTVLTPCRTGERVHPPGAARRAVAGGEDQPVPLLDDVGGAAGLSAGPLLEEEKLAAGVVDTGAVEPDHDLQRKREIAVQIAVQRIPVAADVPQHQRCGLGLARGMTHFQPLVEVVGPGRRIAEPRCPVARGRQQVPIEDPAELGHLFRYGRTEVLVGAVAVAVAGHVDGRPEAGVVVPHRQDLCALGRFEQRAGGGATVVVEFLGELRPGQSVHARGQLRGVVRHAASFGLVG